MRSLGYRANCHVALMVALRAGVLISSTFTLSSMDRVTLRADWFATHVVFGGHGPEAPCSQSGAIMILEEQIYTMDMTAAEVAVSSSGVMAFLFLPHCKTSWLSVDFFLYKTFTAKVLHCMQKYLNFTAIQYVFRFPYLRSKFVTHPADVSFPCHLALVSRPLCGSSTLCSQPGSYLQTCQRHWLCLYNCHYHSSWIFPSFNTFRPR